MNTDTLDFPAITPDCEYPAAPKPAQTVAEAIQATAMLDVVDIAEVGAAGAVVKYSRTEAALADLREKYAGKTFDLTTTKGDDAARAARLELKKLRTGLEAKRKEFKAPAIAFGRLIDTEADRITAEIKALEDPIDAQIRADEQRRETERLERGRVAAARRAEFEAKIAAIRGYVAAAKGLPSERIAKGLTFVEGMAFGEEWAEFASAAAAAQGETVAALRDMLETVKAAEAAEAQRVENARVAADLAAQRKALEDAQAELDRRTAAIAEAERKAQELEQAAEADRIATAIQADAARAQDVAKAIDAQAGPQPLHDEEQHPNPSDEVTQAGAPLAPATAEAGHTPGSAIASGFDSEPAAQVDAPATMKLGDISKRLGFTLTEAFVRDELRIPIHGTDKRAVLIAAFNWTPLKIRLIRHIEGLA